ncbi:MAG: TolB family protein [Chloroflexota bacterium]
MGRLIGTSLVLVVLAIVAYGATSFGRSVPLASQAPGASREISGRIVVPMDAGLSVFDLPSLKETKLLTPDRAASVTSAIWSPSGAEITYGYFYRKPGDTATSAEIFVISAGGGEPQVLVERDGPGAQTDFPSWTPDGKTLYFSTLKQEGPRYVSRVEKLDRASGERTALTEGYAPWVSRDGALVSFLRDTRVGQELWLMSTDGGEPRPLIRGGRFTALSSPRFTPDSKSIMLAAALPLGTAETSPALLHGLFSVPTAFAHGDPFDLWTVSTEGGEPTKFAISGEDEPALAWSPDGQDIVMYAPGGIYHYDLRAETARKISDRGGYGGIDWVR